MMLGDITQAQNIYIACGYTDMRKSIDGLAAIVQQQFQLDPFSRNLLEEDGQLNLFNEIEVEGDPTRKEKDPIQVSRNKVKVRQPKTRREVVTHGLPEEEVVLDIPEKEANCIQCGSKLKPIGKKVVREALQYIPASLKIIRYVQISYECPRCKHTDGYKGYNLVNGVTHCYCWVHLRRLFYQASKSTVESEGTLAAEALKMIQELANKEKALADMSTEERQTAREKEETPILAKFWQWIDVNQGRCLPKSLLGKAFTYAQNQKDGLMNYLQYGNCDMTNNIAENSIRPFVVGRKNWEFSAAVKGAEASAAAYSIIETAKANGLDCRKYLTYLFEKLSQLDFRSKPDLFEWFLPWQPEIQENCK